ncbi:MBL fold metallo-hydrolase [Paenibacillus protaetiae]|uniref:MBL fold metallo-hydrolase n=1 Tax=Paenibacillus protaetiae TaxID=2509456 RepID=A0A4P6EVR4_9BACL|nr:MBL fold metallo-hydrolase [Paenibacillus protaetiae]QAY67390.1 MBL fold metallo-hydrolase [Paenibacillus protaetiae]
MLDLQLGQSTIHPTIVYDKESWTLIDTGMPGSAAAIYEQAKQAGLDGKTLQSIIFTHQDVDHIGGFPQFLAAEGADLPVYAHPDDKGAIDGTEPMFKMSRERLDGMLQQLPEDIRNAYVQTFLQPNRENVNRTVADGEILPIAGGLTVIHTPGHTPGHISLYHAPSKTLITGDATIANEDGQMIGPNPPFTPNWDQALQSLKKFKNFDIEHVICYHGGWIQKDVKRQINELAELS